MSHLEGDDPIMIAVLLLAVEPTDRALAGWFPFRKNPGQAVPYAGDRVLGSLLMTGAGRG
jgi:hypothetical protein